LVFSTLTSSTQTVEHAATYFGELKQAALQLLKSNQARQRGYFTPVEEHRIRSLQVSYWKSRSALLELIAASRDKDYDKDDQYQGDFLVAFAAALVLIDAARFLREQLADYPLIRQKLNEPAVEYGVPVGSLDQIQRNLLSARHAWHLYHALCYLEQRRQQLSAFAKENQLGTIWKIIERLENRLRVSTMQYAQARLRVRGHQAMQNFVRGPLWQALYGLQKVCMGTMANVFVRPRHRPALPNSIASSLLERLRPGDVLAVRKEFALTNYFLPGYWPHVAVYLGDEADSKNLGLYLPGITGPRVLESMKDGVHVRPIDSPFASDSVVVLRPKAETSQIAEALARGLTHRGKPYDFDFDFSRADRLVCTEVVYRCYHEVGDMKFALQQRMGRPTLSGSDLVNMAIEGKQFSTEMVYAPTFAAEILTGSQAKDVACRALNTNNQ